MPSCRSVLAAFLAIFAYVAPASVQAQAWQCQIPAHISAPRFVPPEKPRRAAVGGYTLALSWSPEYCRTHRQNKADQTQCSGTIGDFGFVLHGLWPEARRGAYPQWCRPAAVIPQNLLRENICVTPSTQLMQHEWAKHGSCMTRNPAAYLRAGRVLFQALEFPDMDRLSRKNPKAGDLAAALAASNPGVDEDMVQIFSNKRGWLSEVRLCLGPAFRPRRCPNRSGALPATAKIQIWRGQ